MKRRHFIIIITVLLSTVLLFIAGLYRHQSPRLLQSLKIGIPKPSSWQIRDNIAGLIHRPHVRLEWGWPEHPKGKIIFTTNNLGFREDKDTVVEKGAFTYRILVTGDSHIDGNIYNEESFPNRLEALLNSQCTLAKCEVINGGVGRYGPDNYLGFLKKYIYLKPDMFVVVLFAGNDFLNEIISDKVRKHIRIPKRPKEYIMRLRTAKKADSGAVDQGLNQIVFFKTYPEMIMPIMDAVEDELNEIDDICSNNNIDLIVVMLPTYLYSQRDKISSPLDSICKILALQPNDIGLNRELSKQLISKLHSRGIKTLDPFTAFESSEVKLFWDSDHHLNHIGHGLLARLFFEQFRLDILKNIMKFWNQPEKQGTLGADRETVN